MDKKALIKKMKEFMTFKEKDVEEKKISISDMTLINLRDCLTNLSGKLGRCISDIVL